MNNLDQYVSQRKYDFSALSAPEINWVFKEIMSMSSVPGKVKETDLARKTYAEIKGKIPFINQLHEARNRAFLPTGEEVSNYTLESFLVAKGFRLDFSDTGDDSAPIRGQGHTIDEFSGRESTIEVVKHLGYVAGADAYAQGGVEQKGFWLLNACAAVSALMYKANGKWEYSIPSFQEASHMATAVPSALGVRAASQIIDEQIPVKDEDIKGFALATRLCSLVSKSETPEALVGLIGKHVLPPAIAELPSPGLTKAITSKAVLAECRYQTTANRKNVSCFPATPLGVYNSLKFAQVVNANVWGEMNRGYFNGSFVSADVHSRNLAHSMIYPCREGNTFKIFTTDQNKAQVVLEHMERVKSRAVFVGMSSNKSTKVEGEMFITDCSKAAILDFEKTVVPTLPSKGVTIDEMRLELTLKFHEKVNSYKRNNPDAMVIMGSVLLLTDAEHDKGIAAARCITPILDTGNCLYLFGKWNEY